MSSRSMWRMVAVPGLAMLVSACGDASTAPSKIGEERVVISVAGISADAAGMVLRLSGGIEEIEPAHPSLELAWAVDDAHTATVAILGPIADVNELLIVRRPEGAQTLSVQVVDVTDVDGVLALSTTARVVISGT